MIIPVQCISMFNCQTFEHSHNVYRHLKYVYSFILEKYIIPFTVHVHMLDRYVPVYFVKCHIPYLGNLMSCAW